MKKVCILFLLTVVLASFTFAIEGVGDFTVGVDVTFDNVTNANGEDLSVSIEPTFNFTRAFGALSLSATLGDGLYIPTGEGDIGDDFYVNITPSYALAAGPGQLGFALGIQVNFPITKKGFADDSAYIETTTDTSQALPVLTREAKNPFFYIDPSISYDLDAGFGALAFAVGTEHLQISKLHEKDSEQVYGLDDITLYITAGLDLAFGLGFAVTPYLVIDTTESDADLFNNIVVDIHYGINEQITAGVETDIASDIETSGVTITPYGEFSFGALSASVKVALSELGAKEDGDAKTLQIAPTIGVSYSF